MISLEIAIASVEDAVTAQAGNADRLELNLSLEEGGLTPSLGTLIELRARVALPVMMMIRPRRSGFNYSDSEFRVMQRDINLAIEHGADGLVFGILNDKGHIDLKRCRALRQQIGDRATVFHRAFDVTPDPRQALSQLIDEGFDRVMTSGQEPTALEGAPLIAELIEQARDQIEILPAGGINATTVKELIARTGCNQVHGSLRHARQDRSLSARPQIRFSSSPAEEMYQVTNLDAVLEMRRLLDSL